MFRSLFNERIFSINHGLKMNKYMIIILLMSFTQAANCYQAHKIYSNNGKYYLESMNQTTFLNFQDKLGYTYVKQSSNDSVLYEIDYFFNLESNIQNVFLSDDAQYIYYLPLDKYNLNENKLYVFYKGIQKKSLDLKTIINYNEKESKFDFYTNKKIRVRAPHKKYKDSIQYIPKPEKLYDDDADSIMVFADKNPLFIYQNELYIIDQQLNCHKISLFDYSITNFEFVKVYNELKNINFAKIENIYPDFYYSKHVDMLPDINSDLMGKEIEKNIKYKYEKTFGSIFYKEIKVKGWIYRDSSIKVNSLVVDSTLPKIDYKTIIENGKYSIDAIPSFSNRWGVVETLCFRDLDDSTAFIEYNNKLQKMNEQMILNSTKDTIDGDYIPKDLYDAMETLDKIVSPETKELFKNTIGKDIIIYPSISEIYKFHLKKKSRLSKYLDKFGIKHFEDQPAFLERSYWHYVHDSVVLLVDNDTKFKLDSNLFVFMVQTNYISENSVNCYNVYKIINDNFDNFYYSLAFHKSAKYNDTFWGISEDDNSKSDYHYFDSSFNKYKTEIFSNLHQYSWYCLNMNGTQNKLDYKSEEMFVNEL